MRYNETIDGELLVFRFISQESIIEFSITEFHSLSDYNKYTTNVSQRIFDDMIQERCLIVAYDWSFIKKKKVSLRDIFLHIQYIGTKYAVDNQPDIIYYQAMNHKLHRVYTKMFPIKGYYLKKVIGKSYIYMRECKDNDELREK